MKTYLHLNLEQKLAKIRKHIPELTRKHYSDEVDYDFVKIDDIYELLTPALNKYGVNFDVIEEAPTIYDTNRGGLVFLEQDNGYWRYEADLTLCWTNIEHTEQVQKVKIHAVGTHEMAEKAKGTAWTYALKYYLLNKFNIQQKENLDPDMREMYPLENSKEEPTKAPKKTSVEDGAASKQTVKKTDKKADKKTAQKTTEKKGEKPPLNKVERGKKNGNPNAGESKESEEGQFSLISQTEGIEPAGLVLEETGESGDGDKTAEAEITGQETLEFEDGETLEETEETLKDGKESVGENAENGSTDGFVPATAEEIPFEESEEFFEEKSEDNAGDEVTAARNIVCNFGICEGKTLGEMLDSDDPKLMTALQWLATRYEGGNTKMKEAAKLLLGLNKAEKKAA